MALFHSPSIITNGLVLCLDAANPKSYDKYENLVTYSNDFSNALWGGYCGNKNSMVYNTTDVISPDGTYNATKIVKTVDVCSGTSPAFGVIWSEGQQVINKTDTYTASIYVRGAVGGETVVIGLADSRAQAYTLTTSWRRITYTGVNDTTDYGSARSFQVYAQGSNVTYYIWGAQVENGSVANDYYATTTTAKTRGTSWSDLSGGGYTATITGTSVWNNTYGGQFDFGDVAQITKYITLPHQAAQSTGTSFTMEFWMRPNTSSDIKYFCSMAASTADNNYFLLQQNISNIRLNSATTASMSVTNNQVIQFCVVRDGSNNGTLYKNGGNAVSSDGIGPINGVANGGWILNQEQDSVGGGFDSTQNYRGSFMVIKLYNRALSSSEIRQNYTALKGRFGLN